MQILRAADRKTTLWKNGGGATTQIWALPEGAGLDDFDARVSMASVAGEGMFSRFAGVDRTLAVLSGAGVELTFGDAPPVTLTPSTPPFSFSGDAATRARLLDGPILDLNVMVRRGKYRHAMTRLRLDAPATQIAPGGLCLVICAEGGLRIETHESEALLSALDAVIVEPAATDVRLCPTPGAVAYVVEIAALATETDAGVSGGRHLDCSARVP